MKKIILIICLSILIITGCEKDNNKTNNKDNSKNTVEVTLSDEKIKLSYENNFLKMYYKESVSKFYTDTMGSHRMIRYSKDNDPIFTIHLVYFKDKNIDEALTDTKYERSTKIINDLEYQYFEYEVNGEQGHTYVYYYDGTTYSINFISSNNINEFEKTFMDNVYFKG